MAAIFSRPQYVDTSYVNNVGLCNLSSTASVITWAYMDDTLSRWYHISNVPSINVLFNGLI